MIVPFHSLNKKDRIEFYGDPIHRKLRDRIIKDEYNVKTDMENLILNIVILHEDISDVYELDDILGYVNACGGYESFDVLFEKYYDEEDYNI